MLDKKMTNQEEVELLINLSTYIMANSRNVDKVLAVLGNTLEAKQIVFAYNHMTEEEAVDPRYGNFTSRITSSVDSGVEAISMSRNSSEWMDPCKLAFGVVASLTTMVRNDVMDNCSEENMEAYGHFIEFMKKSVVAGTDAISISSNDNKNLEDFLD